MKGHQILIGAYQGRETAALISDGALEDLLIDSDAPRPGTVYRGRAARPVKGQGGMFFDTPDGSAFLRSAKGVRAGEMRLLQVSGFAEPGKAIPVTDRLLFKSRYAIATPGAPGLNISRAIKDDEVRVTLRDRAEEVFDPNGTCGLILRSAAEGADLDAVCDDIAHVAAIAQMIAEDEGTEVEKLTEGPGPAELAWRDWPDAVAETAPHPGEIDTLVGSAVRPDHMLQGGGTIWVEPTRACTAVDVNTGADTSPSAGLKANIAAARALPRLLRIKGLGGQVVVDFAAMPKKDRRAVESALRAAFRGDTVETTHLGWTTLGHFEMTRKRARAALHEVLK